MGACSFGLMRGGGKGVGGPGEAASDWGGGGGDRLLDYRAHRQPCFLGQRLSNENAEAEAVDLGIAIHRRDMPWIEKGT